MKYKIGILSLAMATIMVVSMVAAAGAVSAAKPNTVGAKATVGQPPITGAPASCYDGAVYWNVAQGAADVHGNNIYWQQYLGTAWTAVGAGTNPTVVAIGAGNVVIVATGTNGALWAKETTTNGASWTNVALPTLNPKAGTGATAVFLAATPELNVLYVATNGNLMDASLNLGTASNSLTNLGGNVFATPAAAATSASSMTVVVKGTGSAIYQKDYAMGGFGLWSAKWHDGTIGLGASLASDTTAAGTNLFLTVSGSNSRLYMAWSTDGGNTWVTNYQQGIVPLNTHAIYWAALGGVVTSAPSSAVTQGTGYAEPLVRGSDGMIWDAGVTVPTAGVVPVPGTPVLITNVWSGPWAGP
jgi:hypothetical protein